MNLKNLSVLKDRIQLSHYGSCHWLLSFNTSRKVQESDSLHMNLTYVSKRCLKSLYQLVGKNGKVDVKFLPVEKQGAGLNWGLFALAFFQFAT